MLVRNNIKIQYVFLILFSFFYLGLTAQTIREHAGKIKSINSKYYTLTNDTTKLDSSCLFKIEIEHYNSIGNLIIDSYKFFSEFSSGYGIHEYQYDNNNNNSLIEKTWISSNSQILQKDSFYYATNRNLLKHLMWFASGEIRGSIYSYDQNNNLTKQEFFNKEGEITRYDLHFFDSEFREIREESWHSTTGFEDSTIYKYDKYSNLIYDLNVDKHGNTTWETYINYNSKNLIMSEIYFENNTFTERVDYEYNEQLDPIYEKVQEVEHCTENLFIYTSSYGYDKMGNWILKVTSEKGKVIEIITREIDYY